MKNKIIFGKYILFENGDCFSIKDNKLKKWSIGPIGYKVAGFVINGEPKTLYLHRLLYQTFLGKLKKGFDVCHNDGNPLNNDLSNLRLDTRKNNMADKIKHGTRQINEKHGNCKYSNELVLKIRKDFANGLSKMEISKKYNIKYGTIRGYIEKRARKWVTEQN